ncbi:serine protease inhibitor ecotin [Kerstersia gyiorum]|uniref:serine protease inhibitor ecotin n=1 Tax=Kerstersia gyiorum TaxID=206506 RepID=UPI001F0F6362|nr:serine protease inhibitor ecotin [Kerstersia gyiorum]
MTEISRSPGAGLFLRRLLAVAGLGLGAMFVAGSVAANPATDPATDLKPFPAPQAGQTRYVLNLESRPLEEDYEVQLIVGKTIPTDCNRQWFMGSLSEETVQGWGYGYYVLNDVKGPASTLMGCPEESRKDRFVSVQGEGFKVRYNSRLPLVVYVPEGFQLRYRLWRASDETWEVSAAD